MKFLCLNPECQKKFIHPAVKRDAADPAKGIYASIGNMFVAESSIETHCCPYCQSLSYDEVVEPKEEITSVKSVDLAEVDKWLLEGYLVESLYAKTATLVKKGAK